MNKFTNALKATGRGVGSALSTTAQVINAVTEENRLVEEMANKLMLKTPGLELTQAKLVAKMLMKETNSISWK